MEKAARRHPIWRDIDLKVSFGLGKFLPQEVNSGTGTWRIGEETQNAKNNASGKLSQGLQRFNERVEHPEEKIVERRPVECGR